MATLTMLGALAGAAIAAPDAGVRKGSRSRASRSYEPFAAGADQTSEFLVNVRVGETVEVDAGPAVGMLCDDLSLFQVDIEDRSHVLMTGRKAGTTLCRVGLDVELPHRIVRVLVSGN